jgi:hypothetical protein
MPHLRFRAVTEAQVQTLSETLVSDLAMAMETSEDNFSFEYIGSRFFEKSKSTASYPFVEVLWFARSQEIQDRAAVLITDKVRKLTQAQDVVVIFQVLEKSAYYENGKHF